MFRSFQARGQSKTPDAAPSEPDRKTATVASTTTPPEAALLSQPVKPPVEPPAETVTAPSQAAAPTATAPPQLHAALTEKHQTAAATAHRSRAGVVIAATGDQGLLGAVSSVIRSELEASGVEAVEAQTLPATEDLVRGGGASAGHLIDVLRNEGFAVLLLARIDPTGQRELNYYGRHDIAYSSRVTLTAYDLATGRPFRSSSAATIEYTSINAESESQDVVGPLARVMATAIRAH